MRCNNCGWNNPDTNSKCEKCNMPLTGYVNEDFTSANEHNRSTVRDASTFEEVLSTPQKLESTKPVRRNLGCDYNSTVRPGQEKPVRIIIPTCKLVPKEEIYDRVKPKEQEFEYEGRCIILNRSNTDKRSQAISSQAQAELTFNDGKWFINNKSELQTTYKRIDEQVELKDGDVILLGDREFSFIIEE